MLWFQIARLPGGQPVTPPKNYSRLFLFRTSVNNTVWLVGQYRDLTRFATDLRQDEDPRDFLSANQVRMGLRDSDVPPADIKR